MPPKQRGANLVGKSKLFRHAIENVHVGIGHTVIGNYAVTLPQMPPGTEETGSLFKLVLDEAMLSYASRDVKQFRAEVYDCCQTKELVLLYKKRILQKILIALTQQGEGYFAFLHFTSALVRDLQEEFLPFMELLFTTVNKGVVDTQGKVVTNPEHQQRVFMTQASWLRDLHPILTRPENNKTVQLVLRLYVNQMCTSQKGFVRRLSAEVLAGFCRRARFAIPIVTEIAVSLAAAAPTAAKVEDGDEDGDASGNEEEEADGDEMSGREENVLDGSKHFILECLRGLKGSLNANFETNLFIVMCSFSLLEKKRFAALGEDAVEALNSTFTKIEELQLTHLLSSTDAEKTTSLRRIGSKAVGAALEVLVGETSRKQQNLSSVTAATTAAVRISTAYDAIFDASYLEHVQILRALSSSSRSVLLSCSEQEVQNALQSIVKKIAEELRAKESSHEELAGAVLEWYSVMLFGDVGGADSDNDDDELGGKADRMMRRQVQPKGKAAAVAAIPDSKEQLLRHVLLHCVKILATDNGSATLRLFIQDILEKDQALRTQMAAGRGIHAVAPPPTAVDGHFFSPLFLDAYHETIKLACKKSGGNNTHLVLSLFLPVHYISETEGDDEDDMSLDAFFSKDALNGIAEALPKVVNEVMAPNKWEQNTSDIVSLLSILHGMTALGGEGTFEPLINKILPSFRKLLNSATALMRKDTEATNKNPAILAIFVDAWALVMQRDHTEGKDLMGFLLELLARESANGVAAAAGVLQKALSAIRSVLESTDEVPQLIQDRLGDVTAILKAALLCPTQSLRVMALQLLQNLSDDEHQQFYESLIEAETADPLSSAGNMDVKKQALTKIAFEANSGRIVGEDAEILARAMLGLLYLKFADVWPTAMRILHSLQKHDTRKINGTPGNIWVNVIEPHLKGVLFANDGALSKQKSYDTKDDILDQADATAQWYRVQMSHAQLHESGVLVAKLGGPQAESHAQVWTIDDIASGLFAVDKKCTDALTVAKTMVGALVEMGGILNDQHTPSPVAAIENCISTLHAIDRREHETIVSVRGFEDRMALAFQLFSATTFKTQKATPERVERLVRVGFDYISNASGKLQKASAELLKRLKVAPFDQHLEPLLKMCAPTKDLLSFLQSFHVDTIDAASRSDFVASSILLALPKIIKAPSKGSSSKADTSQVVCRKIMKFLNAIPTKEELCGVIEMVVSRLVAIRGDTNAIAGEEGEDKLDFLKQFEKQEKFSISRQERFLKQLVTALRLISEIESTVGASFAPWAERSFNLALFGYASTNKSLHPHPKCLNGSTVTSLCGTARKLAGKQLVAVFDHFPEQMSNAYLRLGSTASARLREVLGPVLTILRENSRTLMLQQATKTAAQLPAPLQLIASWVKHEQLHTFVVSHAEFIASVFEMVFTVTQDEGKGPQLQANPTAIYAALQSLTDILMQAEEDVEILGEDKKKKQAILESTSIYDGFIAGSISTIFTKLHALVMNSNMNYSKSADDKKKRSASEKPIFNLKMWKEVIQTVATCAAFTDSETSTDQLAQLAEIMIKFLRSPTCAAEAESAEIAASVLESLVERMPIVHPKRHYISLATLFNAVTNPVARDTLVRTLAAASDKVFPDNEALTEHMIVTARVVRGLNSFAADDTVRDEDGQQKQAYTAYDFDFRFHTMYSLISRFTGDITAAPSKSSSSAALTKKKKRSEVSLGKDQKHSSKALPAEMVRTERQYEGDDNVELPEGNLPVESLSVIIANVLFFLRDREASIRGLASQTLAAVAQYGTQWISPVQLPVAADEEGDEKAASGSDNDEEEETKAVEGLAEQLPQPKEVHPFVVSVVRPYILATLRQGVVAKDANIRNEHMQGFGALAKRFPNEFPSFAAVYNTNAEQSFYFNIKDAQHKCRMNALALLRKKADAMNVRDVLRVFVPFLVAVVKDFAQGKRSDNTTEGKSKGFTQSALLTIAAFAKHMPWEGYLFILKILISSAKEFEDCRSLMLSGVVEVLGHFGFLEDLEPGVRPKGRSANIISTLERDVLKELYSFIQNDKKSNAKEKQQTVGEAAVVMAGGTHTTQKKTEQRTIVQLPVAVAIIRIVKKFPFGFDNHIELLVTEVVAKLRTKNDKHREGARRVLCSMMEEIGIHKLGFVMEKLKDQLIHGYQLHVLGYTAVVLLDTLKAKFEAEERGPGLTTTLDRLSPKLMDIFLDDYLGELGEQKDQTELKSTILEVKRSRAAEGFVFLARYASGATFLNNFSQKVKWLIAPPKEELIKNASNAGHVQGFNAKYLLGDKKASADLRFVTRVQQLCSRVARGLMLNDSLDNAHALTETSTLFRKNIDIRNEKIRQFEAKDGRRRIRGNIEKHTNQQKLSQKEQFETNFAVAAKPERNDMDFGSHTVLATQHKQKLRKYIGKMGKDAAAGQAAKDFSAEDPTTAVVLDTLDEFYMRLLLSILKRVLSIGKDGLKKKQQKKKKATKNEFGDEDSEEDSDEDGLSSSKRKRKNESDDDEEGEEKEEKDEEGEEEEEEETTAEQVENVGGEELDEFELAAQRMAKSTDAEVVSFTAKHQKLLSSILPLLLEELEGEGSDSVVSLAMDNIHSIISLRPPLTIVKEVGPKLFSLLVMFFERGGAIKKRAMRVVSAVIQHQQFVLDEASAKQLMVIARGEIIERSDYLPMALAVTLAVVSKRITIIEVYDIIQPITELMMHLSISKAIRERAVAVIAKFLTEYKMTMDKVRSHIDLYVRNLNYPEATGRLALLELLQVLVFRLPTVVLQQEGAVMFIPVVSTTCQDEAAEVREKASEVLKALVINAGLQTFQKTLSGWLDRSEARFRTTALQALAHALTTVQKTHNDARAGFNSVAWTIPHILAAVLHKQEHHNKKKNMQDLKLKEREAVEMKHWEYIFFGLKCAEALMGVHVTSFAEQFAAQILPHLFSKLISHTHPWIRQASMRLIQGYLYNFVDAHCGYMNGGYPAEGVEETTMETCVEALFAPTWYDLEGRDISTFISVARDAVKRVITQVEHLDVLEGNRFQLNRALEDPHRGNVLKVVVLLSKLIGALSSKQLVAEANAAGEGLSVSELHSALAKKKGSYSAHVASIWTQASALAQLATRNGTPEGYVVRSMTLVQLFGGMIATLPEMPEQEEGHPEDAASIFAASCIAQGMAGHLSGTVIPLLGICAAYEDCNKLQSMAKSAVEIIKNEVEKRKVLFAASAEGSSGELPKKRSKSGTSETATALSVASITMKLEEVIQQGRAQRNEERLHKMHEKNVKAQQRANAKEMGGGATYRPAGGRKDQQRQAPTEGRSRLARGSGSDHQGGHARSTMMKKVTGPKRR